MSLAVKTIFNQKSEDKSSDLSEEDIFADEGSWKTTQKKKWSPKITTFRGVGIICALLAALCHAINSLLVKLVPDLHPIQLSLSRVYVQFLIILPIVQSHSGEADILGPKGLRFYLWLRGFAGSGGMVLLYQAVMEMSVGNADTIAYISMILVPFMARIFLKESLTVLDMIFALVSLAGVVLIAQPTFLFPVPDGQQSQTSEIGVLYALGSAVLQAIAMVSLRKLGKQTPAVLNVLYYSACGALTTTILLSAIQEWRVPCWHDLPCIFSFGVVGVIGQYFLTVALQNERAGTVGVLRSTQIIMIYILQVVVLGDYPTMLSMVGAALVFSSSIGIGVRKIVNERKRRKSIAKKNSMSKIENSYSTSQTGI